MNRRSWIVLASLALLVAGCSSSSRKGGGEASDTPTQAETLAKVSATFEPFAAQVQAVTYNEAVPKDKAKVQLTVAPRGQDETTFLLQVTGLEKNHAFGAHLHTKPCGAAPNDSGPHYQNHRDPKTPSTDPAFANDANEVWLDFTTDANGDAKASRTVAWRPRHGEANSIVIHAHHTATGPGVAGTAGDRWACVNVPL